MNESWSEWPVARFEELPSPGARRFLAGDGDWPFPGFVVRQEDDVFAYANVCPHQRHTLDLIDHDFLVDDGRMIRCASHGALFLPDTGQCIAGPCVGKSLLALACRVADGVVFVRAPGSLRDIEIIFGTNRSETRETRP